MFVRVDLASDPGAVTLEEPDDCGRFHVEVVGGHDERGVGDALGAAGVGRLGEGGAAFVAVDAVRRLAAGRVADGWDDEFGKMVDFARSRGWLDAAGEAIQAHIEWPG